MRRLVLAIVLAVAVPACGEEPANPDEAPALRPSGFWGTTQRSQGGAYRWRLLGIGVVLAIGTGLFMRRLIKRANAEREARAARERERLIAIATLPVHTVTSEATFSADGKLVVKSDGPVKVIRIDDGDGATRSRDV